MRLDIDKVTLAGGNHGSADAGMCIMEAVAYIAHEQHSDHPQCVSPVIAAFLRSWNDAMTDEDRQQLKPLIPVVMDTVSTRADESRRAWLCFDWLVRVHTTAWLRLAGLTDQAARLEHLPELCAGMDVPSIQSVIKVVQAARDAARAAAGAAARDAAGAAARAAAGAAARAAAGAAARDAARDAARAAAGAAARDAAWAAAGAAARDAAWAAARAAAWAAAGAAAWAAAWAAARAAAGAAAGAGLRPTIVVLQASAMELVERMCWLKDENPSGF
jgi:hypothetical protein